MSASMLAIALLMPAAVPAGTNLAVVTVSPARHALSAPVNASIQVDFDQPVNPASVTPQSFWAFGRWSGTALGTYAFSNGNLTVTLTPAQPFSAGEQVMVILANTIESSDGDPLRTAGYSWQFWTAAQPSVMDFQIIGQFSTRTIPTQSSRAYGGFASDLDEDRFLDITIVNEDTADLRVFLNNADHTGTFQPFIQPTFPVGARASPSEPSDFNRDGHVDVCVANIDANTVSILLGNGDGTFAPQQLISVGSDPRGIAVLDVDGDGDTDIVNTNWSSNNMSLMLNDGSGVFGPDTLFEGGAAGEWALAAADMNDDGILDLVIGAQNAQQVIVSLGNGNGTFSVVEVAPCGGFVWMLNTGDLDGDGDEDIALANSASNNGSILRNNGNGELKPPEVHPTDPFTLATDIADLDGDGDLDWVTSSYNGDWRLRTNDGAGNFTLVGDVPAPDAASCSIALDFDNDGDLDLALIDELDDVIILMRNSGFTAPPVPAASAWALTALGLALVAAATIVLRRQSAHA